jgi:head-tail adaptor
LRAGRLDRLITIQRKTLTSSDSGDVVETWTTLIERRAAGYRPLKGEERFNAAQVIGTEQVEFRIRYSSNVADLSQRDRIVYPALADESPEDVPVERDIFDILAVHEIGRREGLLIITQRRADATS